ncbi:MAG: hypothetical protein MJ061_06860 [Mailhella sp.]|nr:hypothetical protein [Mailhella sp.]
MKKGIIAAAAALMLSLGIAGYAEARGHLSIGVGVPLYAPYVWGWGGYGWHGRHSGVSIGVSPWYGIGVAPVVRHVHRGWYRPRHHGWYAAPAVVVPAVIPSATIRFSSDEPRPRTVSPGWYPVGQSPVAPVAPAGLSPAGVAPVGAAPGMAPGELPIRPVRLPSYSGVGYAPAAARSASPAGAMLPAGAEASAPR